MAQAKMIGSGWHKQSLRHSNAKRFGRAGGTYAKRFLLEHKGKNKDGTKNYYYTQLSREEKINFLMKSGLHRREQLESMREDTLNDFFKAGLEAKGFKLNYMKDSDGDGVPDKYDCQPHNPHAQDTYELRPIHDTKKSFYGKAKVETEADDQHLTKKLYSYGTLVAEIKDDKPIVYGTYSSTTLRHIKEFLKQNGQKAETSKQILKDYSPSEKQLEQKSKEAEEESKSMMKTTAMVAKLGELFGKDEKEKNVWKKRMLKAGMKGLDFPEDFEQLPEAEKKRRLDKVIEIAEGKE